MTESHKLQHTGRSIEKHIETDATPQQAWEAWADPEKIAGWFVDRAKGEAVEGGDIVWSFERFNYHIPYKVIASDPGRRFAIAFEGGGRSGLLEVDIETSGGRTRVRLVNSGFDEGAEWDAEYEGVDSGWQMALACLGEYLARGVREARGQFFAARPAEVDFGVMPHFHREAEGLSRWLTREGALGPVGSPCSLVLQDGTPVTGRVLTHTRFESAVSWDEVDGVLLLKAFKMGPGPKNVCVHGWGWGLAAERAQELERFFESALERLVAALPS